MDERKPCPLCQHNNPSEDRFCESCGASLTSSKQLVPHREDRQSIAGRTLPAKLGPTSKALAVGLATLVAEAGLLWLRRRIEGTDRPQLPASQDTKFAVSEYLISQSFEEVSVWLREGDNQSRIFTRRVVRSLGSTKPMEKRR
jgi:hypothetical protein